MGGPLAPFEFAPCEVDQSCIEFEMEHGGTVGCEREVRPVLSADEHGVGAVSQQRHLAQAVIPTVSTEESTSHPAEQPDLVAVRAGVRSHAMAPASIEPAGHLER